MEAFLGRQNAAGVLLLRRCTAGLRGRGVAEMGKVLVKQVPVIMCTHCTAGGVASVVGYCGVRSITCTPTHCM